MSKQVGLDKQAMREFGHNLWLQRQEKCLTLRQLSKQLNIPERIIDGMEVGRFVNYGALRRMMNYYGKTAHIVFK
jgi:hypothetical protein